MSNLLRGRARAAILIDEGDVADTANVDKLQPHSFASHNEPAQGAVNVSCLGSAFHIG